MIFLYLFIEFFKTGLFSIGGGLATIPFLTAMGEKWGWFTNETLGNMIAVGESTPGPIGVNMATYVGYNTGGVLGAIVATLGLVMPSVIIIMIIANFLRKFRDNVWVERVFTGIRPASAGMLLSAFMTVCMASLMTLSQFSQTGALSDLINEKAFALFILLIPFIVKFKKIHPLVFLAVAAVVGIILKI